MIDDIRAVMWKERRELFRRQGSRRRALLTLLVPVAMFAVYMPWSMGQDWLATPFSLIASLFIPALLVGMMIPESFAGERERHTLGTLLASRLPDRAILFGKVGVAVGYAWGITLLAVLLALVTANATHWEGQVMVYAPNISLAHIALSFLMSLLSASAGVLISLRAATVQGATQALSAVVLFPPLLLGIAATALLTANLEWSRRAVDRLGSISLTHIMLVVGAFLAVVCLVLLWAAMARFRRARLILD